MSNARKLADNLPTDGQLGNRRLNINGDMKVAQRASSAATSDGSNEGYNTLDRWYILYSSSAGGAATMSQDTTVPNASFANSLKLDVTTADTSISANHAITLQYRFEAQDIANSGWDYTNSNSNMSVSFWARSVKAGTYCVFFFTQDGTQKNLVQEYTLEANTWKHVTLTFKGDSGISFNDDTGLGLIVGWTLVAGSNRYDSVTAGTWITTSSGSAQGRYATSNQVNFFDSTSNNFYLTGVQIEVGSQASPFEHEPISTTLAKCQRYFVRYDGNAEFVCQFYSTSNGDFNVSTPVTMRAAPSLTTKDKENTANKISLYSNGYTHGHNIAIISSRSIGNIMTLRISGVSSGTVGVNEAVQVQFNDLRLDAEI